MRLRWAILVSLSIFACAHPTPRPSESAGCSPTANGFHCPLTYKKYKDDLVSVQSTVDLAFNSYVLGCVMANRERGFEGSREGCVAKAHQHVEQTVIFILDQDPVPTTPAEYRKSRWKAPATGQ